MSEASTRTIVATAAILAVGAILLGATALIGSSEEIGYPDTFDFDPAEYDPGTAVVISKRMDEGSKFLGFEVRKAGYEVDVAFTVPGQDCYFALADRDQWPVADPGCAGPERVSGTVSGLGSTPEGDSYVGVTVSVGEECYTAIALGMEWQSGSGSCP